MPKKSKKRQIVQDNVDVLAVNDENGGGVDPELEEWDAFREEFFEVVEQLPLSLHRSFALMKELDQQSSEHTSELLQTVRNYISLRESNLLKNDAVSSSPTSAAALVVAGSADSASAENVMMDVEPSSAPPLQSQASDNLKALSPPNAASPALSTGELATATIPNSKPFPKRPRTEIASRADTPKPMTTVEMLARMSWLSSENVRASEEKVALAQAAYDSVDRHVRALDLTIKEQENSIVFGLRPGTRPIFSVLPGVTEETADAEPPPEEEEEEELIIGVAGGAGREKKKSKKRDRKKQKPAVPEENGASTVARTDMPVDPNEPRYCYCNQVSYGEMIACDNDECQREWFHLGCAGLNAAPKGRWYCRECEERLGRVRRKK